MRERFDAYVERCLYDPERGFYRGGGGTAGRRHGDFLTSPEVGPLFAEVLSRALDHWWDELDRPDPYVIYDAGTGPGTLARGLDRAPSRSSGARVVRGFDQADGLPDDLGGSVIIANEVLDNIGFRVVERTDIGWSELYVVTDPAGGGVEELRPLEPRSRQGIEPGIDERLGPQGGLDELPVGTRVPLLDQAAEWVANLLARDPAVVITLDYGAATTLELARRGGWLRTYRSHDRGDDPLVEPGSWDITTDVALDQLPSPTEVVSQADFLRRWGIDDLVSEGRTYWAEHASQPDLAALRMRSRIREAEALLDPAGLGAWLVATWRRA